MLENRVKGQGEVPTIPLAFQGFCTGSFLWSGFLWVSVAMVTAAKLSKRRVK